MPVEWTNMTQIRSMSPFEGIWGFQGSGPLLRGQAPVSCGSDTFLYREIQIYAASRLQRLRARARWHTIKAVFVGDNRQYWLSASCAHAGKMRKEGDVEEGDAVGVGRRHCLPLVSFCRRETILSTSRARIFLSDVCFL